LTYAVTASIDARISGTISEAIEGIGTPQFAFDVRYQKTLANGDGDSQVDDAYVATLTIPAGDSVILILSDLISTVLGRRRNVNLSAVKKLAIKNLSTAAGDDLVLQPGVTNGWTAPFNAVATSELHIPASGQVMLANVLPGWAVTLGSADQIEISNAGESDIEIDIEIAGVAWTFDPSTLSENFCHLDADDNATVLNSGGGEADDGDQVATWNSKVGSYSFTQGTATNRPTYHKSGLSARQKPYLLFDAANSQRLIRSGATFQAATSGEMFVVVVHTDGTNDFGTFFGLGLTGSSTPWLDITLRADSAGGHFMFRDNAGSLSSPSGWMRSDRLSLINIRHDDTNVVAYKGHVLGNAPAARSWFGDITSHNVATIGGLTRTTFVVPLTGKIYELIFFDAELSAANRAQVHRYFRDKHGLYFWAALGDSLTKPGAPGQWPVEMGGVTIDTPIEGSSFIEHADGSETTTDALGRWTNDIKGAGYDALAILSSINDPIGSIPSATGISNLTTIVNEAVDEGLRVILSTIAPFGNYIAWSQSKQDILDELNAWIRDKAAADTTGRLELVEAYDNMGDPADPKDLLAAYDSGDGIHWTQAGDLKFCDLAEQAIKRLVPA